MGARRAETCHDPPGGRSWPLEPTQRLAAWFGALEGTRVCRHRWTVCGERTTPNSARRKQGNRSSRAHTKGWRSIDVTGTTRRSSPPTTVGRRRSPPHRSQGNAARSLGPSSPFGMAGGIPGSLSLRNRRDNPLSADRGVPHLSEQLSGEPIWEKKAAGRGWRVLVTRRP
jgi:hypothetical protein